jgi:membrane protein YdbS with pleckstrin-like domain
MLRFLYEPRTTRKSVTTLGGRGMTWVERPVLKDRWELVGIVLVIIALVASFVLIEVAQYMGNHHGNWLIPFGIAIALMTILTLAFMPWWRWKVQYQARRNYKNRQLD